MGAVSRRSGADSTGGETCYQGSLWASGRRRGGGEREDARVGGYDGYAVAGMDAGVDKAIGEVLDALRPVACVNVRAGTEHDESQRTHQTA